MNGLEYLATLPAYMVNLDRSTERWAKAQHRVKPYVKELTRVPGLDGKRASKSEIRQFALDIGLSPDLPERTSKGDAWLRGTYGCYVGHCRALEAGIAGGGPFLVLEDDAGFYRNDLAAMTEAPTRPGAYVWGGAIKNGSYMTHLRKYLEWSGQANPWNMIFKPEGLCIMTAYSFTDEDAARRWRKPFVENPHGSDVAWWSSMREVSTYVTPIEIIPQDPLDKSVRATSALKNKHAGGLFLESIVGGVE